MGKEKKALDSVVLVLDSLSSELADNTELYEMSRADEDFDGLQAIADDAARIQTEVEKLEFLGDARGIVRNGLQAGVVLVGAGHLVQLGVVRQLAADGVQHEHDGVERLLFLAQLLGLLGVVPDRRIF